MKRLMSIVASLIIVTTLFSFVIVGTASAHGNKSPLVLKPFGFAPSCDGEHNLPDQLLGVNNDKLYYDGYFAGCLVSNNGQFVLVMQTDGNLVLYDHNISSSGNEAIWATNTAGKTSGGYNYAILQGDCNLVVYEGNGHPIWASGTAGRGNTCDLRLQNDGNLVIYGNQASANAESGNVIWSTATENYPFP